MEGYEDCQEPDREGLKLIGLIEYAVPLFSLFLWARFVTRVISI